MRIFLKTEDEINLLRTASQLVSKALTVVGRHVVPTVALGHLRDKGIRTVREAFRDVVEMSCQDISFQVGLKFYINGASVASSSEEDLCLSFGDSLTVECWVCLAGFYSFGATTFIVGLSLLKLASYILPVRKALAQSLSMAVSGHSRIELYQPFLSLRDDSRYLVDDVIGFGIGRSLNESPTLRLSASYLGHQLLKEGMALVIAPKVQCKVTASELDLDTSNASLAYLNLRYAQTLIVRSGKPEILVSL